MFPIIILLGVVVATIGAIILLPNAIKFAVNSYEPAGYIYDSCLHNGPEEPVTTTEEVYQKCIEDRTEREQAAERSRQINLAIDGGSVLLIGLVLVLFSRKRS